MERGEGGRVKRLRYSEGPPIPGAPGNAHAVLIQLSSSGLAGS